MCCIVPSLGCIFAIHTSGYKMVLKFKNGQNENTY